MNGIEVTVNINLNGEKVAGITTGEQAAETLPPGDVGREVTQEEEQRFAVASDLANVCEYLEDSEVIKIRLIVNKAQGKEGQSRERGRKMTQHTAAIVIAAVMAAGVMVTATTAAVAAVKALRDYMKERDKKNETWIDPRSDRSH